MKLFFIEHINMVKFVTSPQGREPYFNDYFYVIEKIIKKIKKLDKSIYIFM